MKKPKTEKWDRNKSPKDWYIASILLRFEFYDEDKNDLSRHCLAWENQILIKASDCEEAYAKAMEHGRLESENNEAWDEKGRKGRWRFEGLTSLLPIYDELGDGAEISWTEYDTKTVEKVKSWVKQKAELEVFKTESDRAG